MTYKMASETSPGRVSVKDVMARRVVTIKPSASVVEAAKLMKRKNIGSLVLVQNGKPVAIITEDDLTRRVLAEGLDPKAEIGKVASRPLVTVSPETSLGMVATLMTKHKIRRLPVLSEDKLVGIVTTTDMVKHFNDYATSVAQLAALIAAMR